MNTYKFLINPVYNRPYAHLLTDVDREIIRLMQLALPMLEAGEIDRTLEILYSNPSVRHNMTWLMGVDHVLEAGERWQELVSIREKIRDLGPDDTYAWRELAEAAMHADGPAVAAAILREGLPAVENLLRGENPDDMGVFFYLAELYEKECAAGELENSQATKDRLLQIAPHLIWLVDDWVPASGNSDIGSF